jgi:hypothetical protein
MSNITSEANKVFWNYRGTLYQEGHHAAEKALIKSQGSSPPGSSGSALVWLLWGGGAGGGVLFPDVDAESGRYPRPVLYQPLGRGGLVESNPASQPISSTSQLGLWALAATPALRSNLTATLGAEDPDPPLLPVVSGLRPMEHTIPLPARNPCSQLCGVCISILTRLSFLI